VGASGPSVLKQIVAEALVLTTFAVALGSFFAVQFPLMHVFNLETQTYIEALLIALFFMYALVAICSLYPGQQAASIYPADALHED
jgi:putative ABC transport system permease protein